MANQRRAWAGKGVGLMTGGRAVLLQGLPGWQDAVTRRRRLAAASPERKTQAETVASAPVPDYPHWEKRLKQLKAFLQTSGGRYPSIDGGGRYCQHAIDRKLGMGRDLGSECSLGYWVARQRHQHGRGTLSAGQATQLHCLPAWRWTWLCFRNAKYTSS